MLSASALAAIIIGFGVAAPGVAEETGPTESTAESATTDDGVVGRSDPGPGPGAGGHPGPGGPAHLGVAAEALGLTADDLLEQMRSGSTLGEIADEAGVDRQDLIDAILADQEERVGEMLDESFSERPMGGPGGRPQAPEGAMEQDAPTLES